MRRLPNYIRDACGGNCDKFDVFCYVQRANYEQLIIRFRLYLTYEGNEFDLPAFIDFRERIYR